MANMIFRYLIFLSLVLGVAAHAQESVMPVADPLTVTDVLIDKTDKNAVLARDAAINDAPRAAFQKLAESALDADAFKTFHMPDDAAISAMVKDFEIRNEKITATRYMAAFTVRFTKEAERYIEGLGGDLTRTGAGGDAILILPVFQTISGKKILWEDPNPWREAWKSQRQASMGVSLIIPAGDIEDVAAVKIADIDNGNDTALEKLRTRYRAGQIMIAQANISGPELRVTLSHYAGGGRTTDTPRLIPIGDETREAALKRAVSDIIGDLARTPAKTKTDITAAVPEASAPIPAANDKISINAAMNFQSLSEWAEAQKRLQSLRPPLSLRILSLSAAGARFTLRGTVADGLPALTEKMAGAGLNLQPRGDGTYTLTLRE